MSKYTTPTIISCRIWVELGFSLSNESFTNGDGEVDAGWEY